MNKIILKNFSYMAIGFLVTFVLYRTSLFMIRNSLEEISGHSQAFYLAIVQFIIMPLCLIVGSTISGYLIPPVLVRRSLLSYLFISPGIYVALFYFSLLGLLAYSLSAGKSNSACIIYSIIASLAWVSISTLSTRLGIYLQRKTVVHTAFEPDAE
jgi:hypothetical protein